MTCGTSHGKTQANGVSAKLELNPTLTSQSSRSCRSWPFSSDHQSLFPRSAAPLKAMLTIRAEMAIGVTDQRLKSHTCRAEHQYDQPCRSNRQVPTAEEQKHSNCEQQDRVPSSHRN